MRQPPGDPSLNLLFSVRMQRPLPSILLAIAGLLFLQTVCVGQDLSRRFGFGPEFYVNATDSEMSDENAGIGARFRVSWPLGSDISLAAGLGIVGFVFDDQSNDDYALNPQGSIFYQLPGYTWAPYVFLGGGGMISVTGPEGFIAAPSIHAGYGWARYLGSVSAFAEMNPVLVMRDETAKFVLVLRTGLIL